MLLASIVLPSDRSESSSPPNRLLSPSDATLSKSEIVLLLFGLVALPAPLLIRSRSGRGTLHCDILQITARLFSNEQDVASIVSLLQEFVTNAPDVDVWDAVYDLVVQTTPQRIYQRKTRGVECTLATEDLGPRR